MLKEYGFKIHDDQGSGLQIRNSLGEG